jgi:SNF2 family DNA or RNA helicase
MMLQIECTRQDDHYLLRMPIHFDAGHLLKQAGAAWNSHEMAYILPVAAGTRLYQLGLGPFLKGDVPPRANTQLTRPSADFRLRTKEPPPFPHQVAGVEWLLSHPQALLADQQGLGKTRQTIDYLREIWKEDPKPAIVVTKRALLSVWEDEIRRWGDDWPVVRIDGSQAKREKAWGKVRGPCVVLTTYDLTKAEDSQAMYKYVAFALAVLDECHLIKSGRTKRGKAVHQIRAPRRLALSGTPIINSPWEIWNILRWLGVESRPYWRFLDTYGEIDASGNWNLAPRSAAKYERYVGTVLLRRTKDTVLDLPPKVYQNIQVEMTPRQKTFYRNLLTNKGWNRDGEWVSYAEGLPLLTKLYQCTSGLQCFGMPPEGGKIDALRELLEDRIENEKVVVFSRFLDTVHAIHTMYKNNSIYLVGGMADSEDSWRRFQEDENIRIFVGSLDACREGLTLTKASTAIFMDKSWAPAYNEQAEDRLHRMGTTGTVNIISLITRSSVDHVIERTLDRKQNLEALLRNADESKDFWEEVYDATA